MTKENMYKYAKRASTRFKETHSIIEAPNKHYAKRTTLLLLSCRTEKWMITECILDHHSGAIDASQKDARGSNALIMAIEANQPDICRKMINIMDTYWLKTEVNMNGKNAIDGDFR